MTECIGITNGICSAPCRKEVTKLCALDAVENARTATYNRIIDRVLKTSYDGYRSVAIHNIEPSFVEGVSAELRAVGFNVRVYARDSIEVKW